MIIIFVESLSAELYTLTSSSDWVLRRVQPSSDEGFDPWDIKFMLETLTIEELGFTNLLSLLKYKRMNVKDVAMNKRTM